MSLIQAKRLYHVNSKSKESGTHSNFTYTLDIPRNEAFDTVCVLDCDIPRSYYTFTTRRNSFTLTEGTSSTLVSCISKCYNALTFKTELQTQLNTASPNHWTYAVAYDQQTNKFSFTVTSNTSQPSFTFTTNLYEQMGFEPSSTNTFTTNALKSVNCINMNLETSLFLRSDMVGTQNDDNIIATVYTSGSPDFSSIVWYCQNVDAYSRKLTANSSNSFRFFLTDEDGYEIDLNGQGVCFTLMLYKKDKINDVVKQYLNQAYSKL